jgi:hypothetical protein
MPNIRKDTPFYQNLLTKIQSHLLLESFDVDKTIQLPKKKETLLIVFPKSRSDISKIEITVSPRKSTYGKTLYHWKHFRVDTPVLEPTVPV